MPIGMIVGGIGELFLDLFVTDEMEKRAAKIALWTATGAIGGVLDCGLSAVETAVGAGIMATTNGVAAGIRDKNGQAVVDTFGSLLSGGASSNLALIKAAAGAGAGAMIGGAAGGGDGAIKGMSLGASLLQGSGVENVAKLGGGLTGGAIGAAASEDDPAAGFDMGFNVGMAVGGATAQIGGGNRVAGGNMELAGTLEDSVEKVSAKAIAECADDLSLEALEKSATTLMTVELEGRVLTSQVGGIATLVGEASAPLIASAMDKDGRDDTFLANWSAMRGITAGASGIARGVVGTMSADALEGVLEAGAALGGAAAKTASLVAQAEARERTAHEKVAKKKEEIREDARKTGLEARLPAESLRLLEASIEAYRQRKA